MEPLEKSARPLDGIRVLELGQLVAGPFAGTMLAWFGADVLKVEPPGGDPIRKWRALDETGTSYWWRSIGRNKRSIVLDLRTAEGRAEVLRLAAESDVLVENFRPGRMEEWGLGPDELLARAPGLVYVRVSGFGQTGPHASRPGYAAVCEAMGGLRHLTGQPGDAPVRANLSLGDTLGGLHAVIGILLALRHRDRTGEGQVVDVALTESVLDCLESVMPEHAGAGLVRGPSGTTITGVVPSNAYPCADGRHVVIGANGDSVFRRLARAIGRADLAEDPSLAENPGRVARAAEIDAAIAEWTRARASADVEAALVDAEVPVGRIQTAEDLARDPQLLARGMFEEAEAGGRRFVLPALAPRLTRTPGRTTHAGLDLQGGAAVLDRPPGRSTT